MYIIQALIAFEYLHIGISHFLILNYLPIQVTVIQPLKNDCCQHLPSAGALGSKTVIVGKVVPCSEGNLLLNLHLKTIS